MFLVSLLFMPEINPYSVFKGWHATGFLKLRTFVRDVCMHAYVCVSAPKAIYN